MYNYNFKKQLGQNFLHDKSVLNNIVKNANPENNDLIIEIGAGTGALTSELKKFNCSLLIYEIDIETKEYLDIFQDEKTTIIYDDFLKRDLSHDLKNISCNEIYIIANLPYYITTPIIDKIIKEKINPKKMILMVQKEVADRLSAKAKSRDYGYITVYLNYFFEVTKLFNVKKESFTPQPKVESAVIELKKHKESYNCYDEKKFIKLIKDSFTHKRKNLKNNLKNYDLTIINLILEKYNLSLSSRAEEVPVSVFVEIANNL